MSAIDSQDEEPFDDESDLSEPEHSEADCQHRRHGKNRPEEDGEEKSARWYFDGTFSLAFDVDDSQVHEVPEPAEITLHFKAEAIEQSAYT